MQKHEIRLNYQQATHLAQSGHYADALEILTELNEVKPDTEGVLYLMAACQAKVGREAEALELCERLIEQFDNELAKQMKERLTANLTITGPSKKNEASTPAPDTKPAAPQGSGPADAQTPDDKPAYPENSASTDTTGMARKTNGAETIVERTEKGADDDGWDEFPSDEELMRLRAGKSNQKTVSQEPVAGNNGQAAADVPANKGKGNKTTKRSKPLWQVLLISAVAAGVAAALLHYLILYRA